MEKGKAKKAIDIVNKLEAYDRDIKLLERMKKKEYPGLGISVGIGIDENRLYVDGNVIDDYKTMILNIFLDAYRANYNRLETELDKL